MPLKIAFLLLLSLQSPTKQQPSDHKDAKVQPGENRPAVISVNPASTNERQAKAQQQPSKRPLLWDIYWPTLTLVIISAIGVCVAISTLHKLERQTKATEDVVHATVNAERAWIIPELVGRYRRMASGQWIGMKSGGTFVVSTEDVLAGKHLAHYLKLTNMGRTPAKILKFSIGYTCLPGIVFDLESETPAQLVINEEFHRFIAGGESIQLDEPEIDVSWYMQEWRADIDKNEKTAIFHGWVEYRHMFSTDKDSFANFCYVFTPKLEQLTNVGRYSTQR